MSLFDPSPRRTKAKSKKKTKKTPMEHMDISSFQDETSAPTPGAVDLTADFVSSVGPELLPPPTYESLAAEPEVTDQTPKKKKKKVVSVSRETDTHESSAEDPTYLVSSRDLVESEDDDQDEDLNQHKKKKKSAPTKKTAPTKKNPLKKTPKKAPTKKSPPKTPAPRPNQPSVHFNQRGRRFDFTNASTHRSTSSRPFQPRKQTRQPRTKSLPPSTRTHSEVPLQKKRRTNSPPEVSQTAIATYDEFIEELNQLSPEDQMAHILARPSLVHMIQDERWRETFIAQLEYEQNQTQNAVDDQKDPEVTAQLEELQEANMNLKAKIRQLEEEKEEMSSELRTVTPKSRSSAKTFLGLQAQGRSSSSIFAMAPQRERQTSAIKPPVQPRTSKLNVASSATTTTTRFNLDDTSASDLSELVHDFRCERHNRLGCTNFFCVVSEKPDLVDVVKTKAKKAESTVNFKSDLLSGARLVKFNLFADSPDPASPFTVSLIKRAAKNTPNVTLFPALAMIQRAVNNISDDGEKTELQECFRFLTELIYWNIRYPREQVKMLKLVEHSYYQSQQQGRPVYEMLDQLNKNSSINSELFKSKTEREQKESRRAFFSSPSNRSYNQASAPASPTPPRTPSFDLQKPSRALPHWVLEPARVPHYASRLYPGYLCCPPHQKSTGCPLGVDRCKYVHECTTCHHYGHGACACAWKPAPAPKQSRFSQRPAFPR